MPEKFTPASFTKNFSWDRDFRRLHTTIRNGFSGKPLPVTRDNWRKHSGINDQSLELIPMNFFLYSKPGLEDDYILVDRLVEQAIARPYDEDFALLALFAFHLANSGSWRHSQWADGRVAGWANSLIREFVWRDGAWGNGAFQDTSLKQFLEDCLEGNHVTKTKVLTNYRHMLRVSGVLVDDEVQQFPMNAPWRLEAVQLFWDRQIFDQAIRRNDDVRTLEQAFFDNEVYKLLACSKELGRGLVKAAYGEYSNGRMAQRFEQLRDLRHVLMAAA